MDLVEVSCNEYSKLISKYVSIFDTPEFNLMNAHKCDEVKYLLFYKNKLRFGLIGGVSAQKFVFPFSAPYASLTPLRFDIKLSEYYEAIGALIDYLSRSHITEVKVTLPPFFYNHNHLTFLSNALLGHNFIVHHIDINYQFCLSTFDQQYEYNIDPKARQKLRSAVKQNLQFKLCKTLSEKQLAYQIIHENRNHKNYPLHLSMEQINEIVNLINVDFFLVTTSNDFAIASAICYHVAEGIIQIIYWGDRPGNEKYRPMNILSYSIFEYYKNLGIYYVDIGPSTQNGTPNFGLSDFKQAIGCDFSVKLNLKKELT